MKSAPLINDASLATAAVLGALSFAAMLSLAHGLECKRGSMNPSQRLDAEKGIHLFEIEEAELAQGLEQVELEQVVPMDGPIIEGPLIAGPAHFDGRPAQVIVEVHPLEVVEPIDKGDVKPQDIPKKAEVITGPKKKEKAPKGMKCEKAPATDINPAFTTDLYQQLRSTEGNVFFSPYSITEAMAMVRAGADGDTASEIAKALSVGGDPKTITNRLLAQRAYLMATANKGDNKLNIANALCVTGLAPKPSYQDAVRKQFQGELFAGGLDQINGWVKQKTEGNIEKILEELDANSACVILNAVYFKGSWQSSFKPHRTHKAPFHLANGKEVKVDMMKQQQRFKVLRDNGMTAVELPYQTSASMVLIQPDKADGMAALEKQFNEGLLLDLGQRLAKSHQQEVELFLPKFKIETSYDLVPVMKELGVKDSFVPGKADFSKMYDRSDIAIAQIKHKATLEVDEEGSVATAATAVEMNFKSAAIPRKAPQIRFDRPFLVLIRDRDTGTNLFAGRISDPTAK